MAILICSCLGVGGVSPGRPCTVRRRLLVARRTADHRNLVPRLNAPAAEDHKQRSRQNVRGRPDQEDRVPLGHSVAFAREIRDDQRRYEAGRRAGGVNEAVHGGRVVGRQVVRVLQIGGGGGAVEAQRQRDEGDADVGLIADVRQGDEEETGDDVGCVERWTGVKVTILFYDLIYVDIQT